MQEIYCHKKEAKHVTTCLAGGEVAQESIRH